MARVRVGGDPSRGGSSPPRGRSSAGPSPRRSAASVDRVGRLPRIKTMIDSVDAVLDAVAKALPAGFPASTWEPIVAAMRRHAQLFRRSAQAACAT